MIAQDKGVEARSALQWLRGEEVDISYELADMETANVLSKKQEFKIKELFRSAYLKPLGVSLGLMFAQQFSGINAVMFYSVSIFRVKNILLLAKLVIDVFFQDAGSSIDSNICTIILGVVNILATLFSNFFIDRLGRKILLYISSVGMIFSLGIFGAYFYFKVSNIFVFFLKLFSDFLLIFLSHFFRIFFLIFPGFLGLLLIFFKGCRKL